MAGGPDQTGEAAFSTRRVRGSLIAFAIGKAISAPLTFLLIIVLAAVMPKSEYANYVSAVSLLEIGVVLGTFGLEWVLQTTMAGVIVRGNRAQLVHAMLLLGLLPFVPYLLLAGVLWQAAPWIAPMVGDVVSVEVLRLYAIVLAIEGPLRMLRDQMLGALLMQRMCQLAQIARIVALFGAVGAWLMLGHELDAATVARAEIGAALLSLVISVAALGVRVAGAWPRERMSWALDEWLGWRSVRFASHAYGSFVLMLPLGTEVMTALVARYLGVDATAAYGFVARLMETARRYLPMDMFYGVLRPAAIGRYESNGAGHRAFGQLVVDVNRMVAANLAVVGVGVAIALAAGDAIAHVLSKGNVVSPPLLLASLLLLLATHSIRRGVEMVAYIVGQSAVFARAALVSVLAPPITVLVLTTTGAVQLAPVAIVVVDLAFSGLALLGLARRGWHASVEPRRWCGIALAAAVAGGGGAVIAGMLPGLPGMLAASATAAILFTWLLVALKIIEPAERAWFVSMIRSRAAPARP